MSQEGGKPCLRAILCEQIFGLGVSREMWSRLFHLSLKFTHKTDLRHTKTPYGTQKSTLPSHQVVSGRQLSSRGDISLVCIWDGHLSRTTRRIPLHRIGVDILRIASGDKTFFFKAAPPPISFSAHWFQTALNPSMKGCPAHCRDACTGAFYERIQTSSVLNYTKIWG